MNMRPLTSLFALAIVSTSSSLLAAGSSGNVNPIVNEVLTGTPEFKATTNFGAGGLYSTNGGFGFVGGGVIGGGGGGGGAPSTPAPAPSFVTSGTPSPVFGGGSTGLGSAPQSTPGQTPPALQSVQTPETFQTFSAVVAPVPSVPDNGSVIGLAGIALIAVAALRRRFGK